MNEKVNLNRIAENSIYGRGINRVTVEYSGKIFARHMVDGSVLELGPAEGIMTDMLYPKYQNDYTVVDAGSVFIESLRKRYPNIIAHECLFEEFKPNKRYDNIILGHVLEHVEDPVSILIQCKSWLDEGGLVLTTVPNANSIHRQAAVEMGLLKKLDDFSEKDYRHGHRRVFFMDTLQECFNDAGLKIQKSGGYWLKPLSDAQLERDWTKDMIDAFFRLGEKYPDIAGELYVVAK